MDIQTGHPNLMKTESEVGWRNNSIVIKAKWHLEWRGV